MYDVFYTRIMIVAIIKTETGLSAVQEFRNAEDEATAVSDFCNEYTPPLTDSDYLGVDGDSTDLQVNWGWDFSDVTHVLKEIVSIVNHLMSINIDESNEYL